MLSHYMNFKNIQRYNTIERLHTYNGQCHDNEILKEYWQSFFTASIQSSLRATAAK